MGVFVSGEFPSFILQQLAQLKVELPALFIYVSVEYVGH